MTKPNIKATSLLSLGHVTVDTYGGFITPLLPFIATKLGVSIAIISMILSISHLASSIMQPVFGYISDSMTKRFFIFWGLIFASCFFSMIGVVNNPILLGAFVVLGALGVGFYHPQATAMLAFHSGGEINKFMGIFTACGTIGYALGPVVSSNIVEHMGLESTPVAILPGILIAFALYKFLPKIPADYKKEHKSKFTEVIGAIFKNKILVILTLVSIIKALVVMGFTLYMPFLWKDQGYSVAKIGAAVASFSALGGIGSFFGGQLANLIGRKKVFLLSLLPILPTALVSLHYVEINPVLSFVLFASIGFWAMLSVSVNIIMAQMALPEYKGMISGVIGGFSWGLMGVMLTPLGILAEKFGVVTILSVLAVIPFIGALLIKGLPKELD